MPDLTQAQRNAVSELLRISQVIGDLGSRFDAAGHRLYLVGGSVRDAMLGGLGHDLDFTTSARPERRSSAPCMSALADEEQAVTMVETCVKRWPK